jgi:hypothetical protein
MSSKEDITKTPARLAYSCQCGWLDLGHMDPKSHREHEGAQSLWEQVSKKTGQQSKQDARGFKVVYQQTHAKFAVRDGFTGTYWVSGNLSEPESRSVALAIFMEVSKGFEARQSNWFYKKLTDSGFSAEDLVSNLIGFYKVLQPSLDVPKTCGVVSPADSVAIWEKHGAIGSHKNKTFKPLLFPCTACAPAKTTPAGSMAGEHKFGAYKVTIADDGKIVVSAGDWLSKYSAAMYNGNTQRYNEFGRMKNGKLEPVADVNKIVTGETLYHRPTNEAWTKSQPGPEKTEPWLGDLPAVFQQIVPATKGTLFRDWTIDDESTRAERIEKNYPARWK